MPANLLQLAAITLLAAFLATIAGLVPIEAAGIAAALNLATKG